MYNLLPVRKNLLKWGIVNDGKCLHCNMWSKKTSNMHFFFRVNLTCYFSLIDVRRILINVLLENILRLTVNATFLIKSEFEELDFLIVLAFWCIYKLLLERNRTGIDRGNVCIKFLFAREKMKLLKHENLLKKWLYCI